MRLTNIYTKVGDKGSTQLATGLKVPKTSHRIEAYGTVDELNSFVGLLRDDLRSRGLVDLDEAINRVQNEMHDLGGELSTPLASLNTERQQVVSEISIARLESEIDLWNGSLPPLANFILPGGHSSNSLAHICRTICRRAERRVCALAEQEDVRPEAKIYLNRLSDWFFVLSRHISRVLGVDEVLWQQKR